MAAHCRRTTIARALILFAASQSFRGKGMAAFLLLVMFAQSGTAQRSELEFQRLNVEDGLISSMINDIAEDQHGFIWIATVGGLSRFDGSTFTNFRSESTDPCAVSYDDLWDLAISPDNKLHIVHRDGWSVYDATTNCFINHPLEEMGFTAQSDQVLRALPDSNGVVWFATSRGLVHYDGASNDYTVYPVTGDPTGAIRDSAEMWYLASIPGRPNLILTTARGGLAHFDKQTRSYDFSISPPKGNWPDISVSELYVESDDTYWVGFWGNGLGIYDVASDTWELHHSPRGKLKTNPVRGNVPWDVPRGIGRLDSETMLVGFSYGLAAMDIDTRELKVYNSDPDNPRTTSNNVINRIIRGRTGHLYIGTLNGLSILDPLDKPIQRYDPFTRHSEPYTTPFPEFLPADVIYIGARHELDDNKVLYSDHIRGGAAIIDFTTGTERFIDVPRQNNAPVGMSHAFTVDDESIILTSTFDIYRYSIAQGTLDKWQSPLADTVRKLRMFYPKPIITNDEHTILWDRGRIVIQKPSGKIDVLSSDKLPLSGIDFVSKFNNLLLVWFESVPYRLDHKRLEFHPVGIDEPPRSSAYYVLQTDSVLWVVPGLFGIYKYSIHNDSLSLIKRYSTADGLPTSAIHRLTLGPNGYMWGGSNAGLFRLNMETDFIRTFNAEDGIQLPYIDEPVLFLSDGTAFFDDRRYIYHFTPRSVQQFNGNCYVHKIEFADTTFYDLSSEIVVSSTNNSFTASLGVIDHDSGTRDKVFHLLEGFDDAWQESGLDRSARYTNLKPGRYQLNVKAQNPDGLESPVVSSAIFIKPAFYQHDWFMPLLALLLAATLYAAYRTRVINIRKSEKRQAEFNKKVAELELRALRSQMNPHFMFNSLNSIKNYILQSEPERAAEYLSSFAHLIRLILQYSQEQSISVQEELDALLLYIELEKLRFRNGFNFNCTINESVDLDSISIPPLILQPYVENAIWHGLLHKEGDRSLSLEFTSDNGALSCIVDDNGIGRSKAAELKSKSAMRYKSMGMGITGDRISILNKMDKSGLSASVEDKYDREGNPAGTRVIIKIPYEGNFD